MVNSQDGWTGVLELLVTVVGVEFTVTVGNSVTVVGDKLVTVGVIWSFSLLTIVTGPRVNTV